MLFTRNLTLSSQSRLPSREFYPRSYLPKYPGQLRLFLDDVCTSVARSYHHRPASPSELDLAREVLARARTNQSPVLQSAHEWEVLFQKKHKHKLPQ